MGLLEHPIILAALVLIPVVWMVAQICVSRALVSMFRYRLWRLRDRMILDLVDKRLPDVPLVDACLRSVEGTIRHASDITFVRWCARPKPSAELLRDRMRFVEDGLKAMAESERQLLGEYMVEFQDRIMYRLVTASPIGWLIFVCAVIWVFGKSLCHRIRRQSIVIGEFMGGLRNLGQRYVVTPASLYGLKDLPPDSDCPSLAHLA